MPRGKKGEGKEQKESRGGAGGPTRERTDEELKNSPKFNQQFFSEVMKVAATNEEKDLITESYKTCSGHDDFVMKLFDLEWFLEQYDDIFNSTKTIHRAPPPRPEPVVKQEPYIAPRMDTEDMDPSSYMRAGMNPNMNLKFEPNQPSYYPAYPQQPTGNIYATMNTQMKSPYPNPAEQYGSPYGAPQQAYPHPHAQPQQMPAHMHPQIQQMPPQIITPAQPPQQTPPMMPVQTQQMPAHIPTQPATPQTPAQTGGRGSAAPVAAPAEKEEPAGILIKHQLQTEFETNPAVRQKLSGIVPLNYVPMVNMLAQKVGKKATDGFYNGLYLAVADYTKNLIDELRSICEMDSDANDMSMYVKPASSTSAAAGAANGQMEIETQKNVLMGSDGTMTESRGQKSQYLVKFSSLQDDQKQIDKLDEREQKDLEDRYTMSKDEDDEKATKKVKKDFTEEDEIIKFLFKTKKDKNQDNENMTKKIRETNLFLDKMTSRSYSMSAAASMGDPMSQKQQGKGRKGGGSQKRVTMKHLIYYLETNPMYKRTPLLHKAYLK